MASSANGTVLASDIVTRAMRALQALGAGEIPTALEMTEGLLALNMMVDSWNVSDLVCYESTDITFALAPGKVVYTVGPIVGAVVQDVTAPRPMEITQAYISDTQSNNFGCQVLTLQDWNRINNRTTTTDVPTGLYYDPAYPNGIINLYPVPTLAYTLTFSARLQLTGFVAQTTALIMPPGYELAYITNLAVYLAMQLGMPIPAAPLGAKNIGQFARESLLALKVKNMPHNIVQVDPELMGGATSGGAYDPYSDRIV